LTKKSILLLGLALALLSAQTASRFALTIDNIMRGPALVGYEPAQVRWSGDSRRIYFQWKQAADKQDAPLDTYVVARDGSGLKKLSDDEAKLAPPFGGDSTQDKRLIVYARDGDIFIYDNSSGETRQITKTADAESNPRFLRDGRRISFTRAGNLYVMSLDTGMLVQLTDITAAGAAAAPAATAGRGGGGQGQGRGGRGGAAAAAEGEQRGTDSQEYLKKEQKDLLETVRERAARRQEDEDKRKRDNPRKPFALQARQSVTSLQLTPDEKLVTAIVVEAGNAKNTIVPSYVTESAYTEDLSGRSNVGDTQSTTRLALIAVDTGEVKWVDHGIRKAPAAAPPPAAGAAAPTAPPGRPAQPQDRDIQLAQPVWSEDGSKAFLVGRAADNKDRWIFALDPATAKLRVLADSHDDAWVDGPGANASGWMKNGREVYFASERTGYSHLYAVPFDGGEARALTSGNWEVLNVRQSQDKSKFYLTANLDGPYENHVYSMDAEGGPLTRLTNAPGKHTTTVSPDDRWIADLYSFTNRPPDLFVQENRPLAESRRLTTSPAPEFSQYPWQDAPIVTFPARDGVKVPARVYKPANFPSGGPAVVFIHGSGYLQNVDRWWSSSYYHEYMFNHLLMERGFLVIDVDYRGSAGYGRDWRTAVYEHMGGKDLDDLVDAAKYVVSEYHVNPKKIGLYGGSYGGFLTLMGMFTQPDVFAAGAALRPVSDWAYYNHGYTADILNLPQTDSEAYRKSSPIYFAQGLKGALLICHGMVDTNVEFQDTVRLVQKLIELRKENWQLAVYPVENHGFVEPTSWADEYKRILKLFEQNLK
jgi:dipeptidyl aminopeptidase/acylaminoacyl peptidase